MKFFSQNKARRSAAVLLVVFLATGCTTEVDRQIEQMRQERNQLSALDVNLSVNPLEVGHRLMEAGEYQLAMDAYERAVDVHGLVLPVLVGLGTASQKMGFLHQARRYLETATDKHPDSVVAWNNLGVVLMEMREYYNAREAFFTAFALDSGESDQIRQNLILAEQKIEALAPPEQAEDDFSLVRQGHGRYLLVPNTGPDESGGSQ